MHEKKQEQVLRNTTSVIDTDTSVPGIATDVCGYCGTIFETYNLC